MNFFQELLVAVDLDLEIGIYDRDLARVPDLYVVLSHRWVVAESGARCQYRHGWTLAEGHRFAGLFGQCSLAA